MREAIRQFLNQNPWVLGILFAGMGLWELGNAFFRHEQHNAGIERAIRRRPWLIVLGWKVRPSRATAISGGFFALALGLALIEMPLGILPRFFWLIVVPLAMFSFFITFGIDKVKSWRRK